jgi:hypothetical protein
MPWRFELIDGRSAGRSGALDLSFGRSSLDSSNCPGIGGVLDLALRGRSVGKRVGEFVDNPQGYPSTRPCVCPRGDAGGGIGLALLCYGGTVLCDARHGIADVGIDLHHTAAAPDSPIPCGRGE